MNYINYAYEYSYKYHSTVMTKVWIFLLHLNFGSAKIFMNSYAKCVTVMTELKCLSRFMSGVMKDSRRCHVAL